jgi:hypothetical protein
VRGRDRNPSFPAHTLHRYDLVSANLGESVTIQLTRKLEAIEEAMCPVMRHPPKAIFVIPELQFAERVSYCCKPCLLATIVPSHVAVFEGQITLRQGEYARLEQRGAYHASGDTTTFVGNWAQLRTRSLRSSSVISCYSSTEYAPHRT